MTDLRTRPRPVTAGVVLDHAVVLTGGQGIQPRPYTTRLPKQLVPLGDNHSMLEVMLRQLARHGFRKVTLAIGNMGTIVRAYVGDGSQWGIEVDYLSEDSSLGALGGVLAILDELPEHFVVMNGNVLTDLNYSDLLASHLLGASQLTVATCEREDRVDFGVVEIVDGRVRSFSRKPRLRFPVSMGVYAVSRQTLSAYRPGAPLHLDDLMADLINRGTPPATYHFDGYWLDIGRPDDYERANQEFTTMQHKLLPETA